MFCLFIGALATSKSLAGLTAASGRQLLSTCPEPEAECDAVEVTCDFEGVDTSGSKC